MSGGHYDRIEYWSFDLRGAVDSNSMELLRMASDLDDEGFHAAAHETRVVVAKLREWDKQMAEHGRRLGPVWKAMDYWRSCDSSEDNFRKVAASFVPAAVDLDPVKDAFSMLRLSEVGIPVRGILAGEYIVVRNTPDTWDRARQALLEQTVIGGLDASPITSRARAAASNPIHPTDPADSNTADQAPQGLPDGLPNGG